MRLRDETTTQVPQLDRLRQFDERSRSYAIDNALVAKNAPLVRRSWHLARRSYLDQLKYGACVSTGIGHDLAATPIAVGGVTFPSVRDCIYFTAQRNDPWPGGEYPGASPNEGGTSVLEGLKAARALGCFDGFSWAFSIDEALRGLVWQGTLIIGIDWAWSMFEPRPSGLLEVSGSDAGGHCVDVTEFYPNLKLPGEGSLGPCVGIAQSWGLGHGNRGRVYMKVPDLEARLSQGGEAAVVTGRKPVRWRTVCAAARG
jgi:hypothetical protein